jgi:hypothetical protein
MSLFLGDELPHCNGRDVDLDLSCDGEPFQTAKSSAVTSWCP